MKAEINETGLLKGLAENEKSAVEAIYKENYGVIHALVINNSGSTDDARDIFQEAMIVLYERARTDHFQLNCTIRTFLYSVARRLWLKKLQQQNRFLISEGHEEVIAADEEMEDHEQRNREFTMMEKAMGSLGEPCKSLLEAFYMQKRSMMEIASDFGYTNAENAKNQKYKCLVRLKKLFFSQYKTDPS